MLAAAFSLVGCVLQVLILFHLLVSPVNPLAIFGCYCLLIGFLIVRSTFLPAVLGVLMMFGGLAGSRFCLRVWLILCRLTTCFRGFWAKAHLPYGCLVKV